MYHLKSLYNGVQSKFKGIIGEASTDSMYKVNSVYEFENDQSLQDNKNEQQNSTEISQLDKNQTEVLNRIADMQTELEKAFQSVHPDVLQSYLERLETRQNAITEAALALQTNKALFLEGDGSAATQLKAAISATHAELDQLERSQHENICRIIALSSKIDAEIRSLGINVSSFSDSALAALKVDAVGISSASANPSSCPMHIAIEADIAAPPLALLTYLLYASLPNQSASSLAASAAAPIAVLHHTHSSVASRCPPELSRTLLALNAFSKSIAATASSSPRNSSRMVHVVWLSGLAFHECRLSTNSFSEHPLMGEAMCLRALLSASSSSSSSISGESAQTTREEERLLDSLDLTMASSGVAPPEKLVKDWEKQKMQFGEFAPSRFLMYALALRCSSGTTSKWSAFRADFEQSLLSVLQSAAGDNTERECAANLIGLLSQLKTL